jgi:uncharacterized protein (TIGR03435 family)
MKQALAATCLIILIASAALTQSAATLSGFEVASISLSDPATAGTNFGISPGGSFFAKGVTVRTLIENSYDVRNFQLSEVPGWLDTERYDIVTQIDNGVPEGDPRRATTEGRQVIWDQLLARVRILLADRFQLKLHRETKDLSVYALVIAGTGSRLQAPKEGEISSLNVGRDHTGNTVITGTRLPLSSLVRCLSGQVDRVIVDRTELKDDYDFTMAFSSDTTLQPELAAAGADRLSAGGDGPSVFTALQKQLGLRLETEKRPVEMLVIDSVQKASEN